MGYVSVYGSWVKKHDTEANVIPTSSKVNVSAPQTTIYDLDVVKKLAAIGKKLAVIKDLHQATKSIVGVFHDVLEENSSDVSNIQVMIHKKLEIK